MPTDLPEDWMTEDERKRRASLVTSTRAVLSAVNWLYWVAGVTVVNALLPLMGAKSNLSLGLGVSRLADELFKMMGLTSPALSMVAAVLSAAFMAALGYIGKRYPLALGVAVVVMLIDTTLFVALSRLSMIGILFRFWVIGALMNGLISLQKIKGTVSPS